MSIRVRFGASLALLLIGTWATPTPAAFGQQGAQTAFPEVKSKNDAGTAATHDNAIAGEESEEGEDDPFFAQKRNEWFIQQRAYPFARIPAGARTAALRQHQALKQSFTHSLVAIQAGTPKSSLSVTPLDAYTTLTWNFDGPSSISAGTGQTPYSGRATSLAINPSNPLIMYLGTAAGGVWGTTNGGQTWAPLTDTQSSLAIGALALDPNNVNTIYAGTGEADYSLDSYYGQGLLKSTDGGATWTLVSSPFSSGAGAAPFAQIAIQPGNSSVLLAATESGLYRSTNAGATWTNEIPSYASAVIFDPVNTNTAYAGMNGYFNSIVYGSVTAAIYKSTDVGVTWTALTGGKGSPLPAGNSVWRTALTLDSSDNLLAGLAPSSGGSGTPYKSTDGGNTWTALTAPGDGLDWYRDWIVSVPGSPNILYTGGVDLYQSLDGGVIWNKSNESYATLLWADQHAAVFSPNGNEMYLMDDGGLFMTAAPASANPTFTSLNNSIASMTFYPGFGIINGTPAGTLVGSQDHGTQIGFASAPWNYSGGANYCGDGGPVVLDAAGVYAYAHCQGSPISSWMLSATGGAVGSGPGYGWVSAQNGITTTDRTAWVPPIATDPSNVTNVYTGTYRVYQSTDRAALWTAISGDLTAGSATLNTIAVAPTNPNVVYAGAGDGTVSVTTNALSGTGATWTKLSGLPDRSISKIVVMPDSSQDVYVVVGGFGSGHIFHSVTGGTTWTDLSGNLPDTPADSVAVDPSLVNTIYLATDTGVYVTSNEGTSWEVLGSNLPNVVVQDIQIVAASRLLRVVTHGRGAWDLTLPLNGMVASTNLITFGNENINTTSQTQFVTLSNNLNSAVTITSISSPANFPETSTCGSSLASATTCTINVNFAPTVTGSVNETLTVVTNQGTLSISLTGTGVVPTPTLSFNCTPNPVTYLQQATCSATVSGDHGGTISITVDGNLRASGSPDSNGTFSASATVPVSSGSYTVAANYSGDANYAPATASVIVTAQPATPTLSFNCTPNPVVYNQEATCSATVSGDHGGTIAITVNGNPRGSGSLDSSGTFSVSGIVPVSSGSYTVTANYSGDTNYVPATTSVIVTAQPATPTLSFNCTPNPVVYQQLMICSATVSGDHGGTIAFTLNGNPWTSGSPNSSGTFSASTTVTVSSGSFTVGANYSGDANYAATSASETVNITP